MPHPTWLSLPKLTQFSHNYLLGKDGSLFWRVPLAWDQSNGITTAQFLLTSLLFWIITEKIVPNTCKPQRRSRLLFGWWQESGGTVEIDNCKCHKSMNTPICNEMGWTLMWLSAKLLALSSCVPNRCFAEPLLQSDIGVCNVRAFLPLCLNQAWKAMCTPKGEDLNELILHGKVQQCRGWLGSSKLACLSK